MFFTPLKTLGRPQENFVSLTPLHSTTAEGIYEKVVAVMDRAHIPIYKMAFCCFDGGSAYAGCHSGVQSLLRQRDNPRLVYIWCRNHLLQLSLVHAAKISTTIRRVIDLYAYLYSTAQNDQPH